jgi:hypothetical protein
MDDETVVIDDAMQFKICIYQIEELLYNKHDLIPKWIYSRFSSVINQYNDNKEIRSLLNIFCKPSAFKLFLSFQSKYPELFTHSNINKDEFFADMIIENGYANDITNSDVYYFLYRDNPDILKTINQRKKLKSPKKVFNPKLLSDTLIPADQLSPVDFCKEFLTKYTINDDGSIDVDGNVFLIGLKLRKIPVKFNKVSGSFKCCKNNLTSLENCPKHIEHDLICDTLTHHVLGNVHFDIYYENKQRSVI